MILKGKTLKRNWLIEITANQIEINIHSNEGKNSYQVNEVSVNLYAWSK